MSQQLLSHGPEKVLLFEPRAVVDHEVHADRLKWAYFWRRAFSVNRKKVAVMNGLSAAGNMAADRRFATRTLTSCGSDCTRELRRGQIGGLLRLGGAIAGLGLAGSGYAFGRLQWALHLPATWPTGRRPNAHSG